MHILRASVTEDGISCTIHFLFDPLSERETLFNPYTKGQVEQIRREMKEIIEIIDTRYEEHMQQYLTKIRKNIK